jgi:hypothetical protein
LHEDREWENQALVMKYDSTKDDAIILNHNNCIKQILCVDAEKDICDGYINEILDEEEKKGFSQIMESCKPLTQDGLRITAHQMTIRKDKHISYYCHFLGNSFHNNIIIFEGFSEGFPIFLVVFGDTTHRIRREQDLLIFREFLDNAPVLIVEILPFCADE